MPPPPPPNQNNPLQPLWEFLSSLENQALHTVNSVTNGVANGLGGAGPRGHRQSRGPPFAHDAAGMNGQGWHGGAMPFHGGPPPHHHDHHPHGPGFPPHGRRGGRHHGRHHHGPPPPGQHGPAEPHHPPPEEFYRDSPETLTGEEDFEVTGYPNEKEQEKKDSKPVQADANAAGPSTFNPTTPAQDREEPQTNKSCANGDCAYCCFGHPYGCENPTSGDDQGEETEQEGRRRGRGRRHASRNRRASRRRSAFGMPSLGQTQCPAWAAGGPGRQPHHPQEGRRGRHGVRFGFPPQSARGPGCQWANNFPNMFSPQGPFGSFANQWADFIADYSNNNNNDDASNGNPFGHRSGQHGPSGVDEQPEKFTPLLDLYRSYTEYTLHLSLPGAQRENIHVSYDPESSILNIQGIITRPGDEETTKMLVTNVSERQIGQFERNVHLDLTPLPIPSSSSSSSSGETKEKENVEEPNEKTNNESHSSATPKEKQPQKQQGMQLVDMDCITAKLEEGVLVVRVPLLEPVVEGFVDVRRVDVE